METENRVPRYETEIRLNMLLAQVAAHLDKPVFGQMTANPDVLAFVEQAVHNEIMSESQQVDRLDALDREI